VLCQGRITAGMAEQDALFQIGEDGEITSPFDTGPAREASTDNESASDSSRTGPRADQAGRSREDGPAARGSAASQDRGGTGPGRGTGERGRAGLDTSGLPTPGVEDARGDTSGPVSEGPVGGVGGGRLGDGDPDDSGLGDTGQRSQGLVESAPGVSPTRG